jgi:hypothetical protein
MYKVISCLEIEVSSIAGKGRIVTICTIGSMENEALYEELRRVAKNWRGKQDARYTNIVNMYNTMKSMQPAWKIPEPVMSVLDEKVPELVKIVEICQGRNAGSLDRAARRGLTAELVNFSLGTVKNVAYGAYAVGDITLRDVHALGFMLAGESGGAHARSKPNKVQAEAKVEVIDYSSINLVVDKAAHENAGPVAKGWPKGARSVKVVIEDTDGKEVLVAMSSQLHTRIRMPEGSRGKQFVLRAAFLRHLDDDPVYSGEVMFTMPLMIRDIRPGQE